MLKFFVQFHVKRFGRICENDDDGTDVQNEEFEITAMVSNKLQVRLGWEICRMETDDE